MTDSKQSVYRFLNYINILERLNHQGISVVSSQNLAGLCDLTASQLRKDLMRFPSIGKQKVGYPVADLLDMLKKEIKRDTLVDIIIIGVGHFGTALIKYKSFEKYGISIVAGFDVDLRNRKDVSVPVYHIDKVAEFIKSKKIELAILAVPEKEAQTAAINIVKAGINKILNLTPAILFLDEQVRVNNVNLVYELEYLLMEKIKNKKGVKE